MKMRELKSEQSNFGGAKCLWDKESAYASLKGEKYFEFDSYETCW